MRSEGRAGFRHAVSGLLASGLRADRGVAEALIRRPLKAAFSVVAARHTHRSCNALFQRPASAALSAISSASPQLVRAAQSVQKGRRLPPRLLAVRISLSQSGRVETPSVCLGFTCPIPHYQPKRLAWVEMEIVSRWRGHALVRLRPAILCRTSSSMGIWADSPPTALEAQRFEIIASVAIRLVKFLFLRGRGKSWSMLIET
jgi:hypothetical protein